MSLVKRLLRLLLLIVDGTVVAVAALPALVRRRDGRKRLAKTAPILAKVEGLAAHCRAAEKRM